MTIRRTITPKPQTAPAQKAVAEHPTWSVWNCPTKVSRAIAAAAKAADLTVPKFLAKLMDIEIKPATK